MQKHFSISVFSPSKGKFNTVFNDITDRKKAEDSIRLLNERFEMAQRAAGAGVWDWDIKTGHVEWSPEMFRLFGLDPQKNLASFAIWKSVLHPEDRERAASKLDQALKGHSFLDNEYRIVRPNGEIIWINGLGQGEYDDQGQPTRMSGICIDITERKKAEEALLRAKNEWELTFNSVPDLVAVLDDQHRIVRVNRAMAQRLGVTPEQCIGKKCYECVHGSSLPPELCPHAQTLKDGLEHVAEVHEDRIGGDFLVSTTPLLDEKGQMIGSVHVARDITEQKNTRQALVDARNYLDNLLNYANAPIIVWDPEFRITMFNHAFERLTGIKSKDAVGKRLEILFPENRKEEALQHIQRTVSGEYWETVEIPILRTDGKVSTVLWNSANICDDSGTKIIATIAQGQDITERKKLEKELQESLNASQCRQSEISALLKASRAVLQNRDFKVSARAVFDACKELIGATAGYVALLSDDGKDNIVLFLESGGLPCSVDPSLPMPIRGLRAETYNTGKVAIENDFPCSDYIKFLPSGHVSLKNVLFAPLTVEGKNRRNNRSSKQGWRIH